MPESIDLVLITFPPDNSKDFMTSLILSPRIPDIISVDFYLIKINYDEISISTFETILAIIRSYFLENLVSDNFAFAKNVSFSYPAFLILFLAECIASSSMSIPYDLPAPKTCAANHKMPDPHPTSKIVSLIWILFSNSSIHIFVVG